MNIVGYTLVTEWFERDGGIMEMSSDAGTDMISVGNAMRDKLSALTYLGLMLNQFYVVPRYNTKEN